MYRAWAHDHAHERVAAAERRQYIVERRAIFAGNDSDYLWEPWNGPLARFFEEAFGHEPVVPLFIRLLQIADTAGAHLKHIELIIPAWRINRQASAADDFHAISQIEIERSAFPEYGGNLRAGVFQRPIPVTGAMVDEIRDFALDRYFRKRAFEEIANGFRERADRERAIGNDGFVLRYFRIITEKRGFRGFWIIGARHVGIRIGFMLVKVHFFKSTII